MEVEIYIWTLDSFDCLIEGLLTGGYLQYFVALKTGH